MREDLSFAWWKLRMRLGMFVMFFGLGLLPPDVQEEVLEIIETYIEETP